MLAGASRSTLPYVCASKTCSVSLPAAGQVAFLQTKERPKMDSPELLALPCRECRRSPVEVLKRLRHGRRYLWCPQCRAIWVVDLSPSFTDLIST
jgi:hypothetical protein